MDTYKKGSEERRYNEMLQQLHQQIISYKESTNNKLSRIEETLQSLVQEMRGNPTDKGVKEPEEFVKPFATTNHGTDRKEMSADSLTHLNLRFPKYDSEKSLTDSVDDYEGPPVFDEDPNKEDYDLEEQKIILVAWEIQEVQTPIVALELFDESSKDEYGIITPILTSPVDTSKKALIAYALHPSSEILFENTRFNSSHDWGGVVLWNSKIGKHVTNNEFLEAFRFYTKMRDFGTQADFSTFICLLKSCCTTCDLGLSKQVHSQACKFGVVNDLIVSTGLVDMYVKCRCTNDDCRLFDELEKYDRVLLNSMIIIYFSVISACVNISPLELGQQHFVLKENMLEVDCPCMTPEVGLKVSGHVDKFTDLMVKDEKTGTCYRADHLLKDFSKEKLERDATLTAEKVSDFKHILAVLDDHSTLGARIKEYGPFNHYTAASFYGDSRLIEGKGTEKEVLDHVHDTGIIELEEKDLAYDGQRSMLTFGVFPRVKLKFNVLIKDIALIRSNGNCSSDHANEKYCTATTLTGCHFLVTALVGAVSNATGLSASKYKSLRELFWFSIIANLSITGMNLSLMLNSVGFYPISKLSMIPVVCGMEWIIHSRNYTKEVKASVVVVLGVGVCTVTYVKVNAKGFICALVAVLSTSLQQIFIGSLQKKYAVGSFELLSKTAPIQAISLLVLGPFVDYYLSGKNILRSDFSYGVTLFLLLSCLLAVFCNISQYLCIGRFSAVSFQVLGHMKTVCVLVLGWILVVSSLTFKNIMGMVIAIVGMVIYSWAVELEKQAKITTQCLDGPGACCAKYYKAGARFAKWCVVFKIGTSEFLQLGFNENVNGLARRAIIGQANGLVPIVEPEILADGPYDINKYADVADHVLAVCCKALNDYNVLFENTHWGGEDFDNRMLTHGSYISYWRMASPSDIEITMRTWCI